MATAKIIELDETNTCKICDNALARYSCPKCNIIYCSLTCYRAEMHLECSENFYKEHVMQELKLDANNPKSKAKMLEILQRMHEANKIPSEGNGSGGNDEDFANFSKFVDVEDLEEDLDSDDDVPYTDLTERLAGVNLDDAETVWEKLTDEERQDFVAFLRSEDMSKLVTAWVPWWTYRNENKVTEVDNDSSFKEKCPDLVDIPRLISLTHKTPSPCVKYNLMNVLAAYSFTARYFNGEYDDFYLEATTCLLDVSATLGKGRNFSDMETAVKSVEQECINTAWIIVDAENIQLIRDDLEMILKGPSDAEKKYYVLCALSDISMMMEEALKPKTDPETMAEFARKFPNCTFPSVRLGNPGKIVKGRRKIEYLLSYAKDCFSM